LERMVAQLEASGARYISDGDPKRVSGRQPVIAARVEHPAVRRMRDLLAGPSWAQILTNLPGYRAAGDPGGLLNVKQIAPFA